MGMGPEGARGLSRPAIVTALLCIGASVLSPIATAAQESTPTPAPMIAPAATPTAAASASPTPAPTAAPAQHVVRWQRHLHRAIAYKTEYRLDFSLAPGTERVIAKGRTGVRVIVLEFTRRGGGPIAKRVARIYVERSARPRIIEDSLGSSRAYGRFEHYVISHIASMALNEVQMLATAYTADCGGCSGITAIGRRAGYGIVAVDPHVIPLGTHLYIPGYGFAIAGDTGGAIRGNRVDLGFNSDDEAIRFGRREVIVYRLR